MKPSNVAAEVEINCTVEKKGYESKSTLSLSLYIWPTYNGMFLQTDRLFPLESIYFLHLLFPPLSAQKGMGRHIPWKAQPAQ